MWGVVLEGVESVLAYEGDQEPAGLGAVQCGDSLDAVEVRIQDDLTLSQRGGAGLDDLLEGGLLLGRPFGDGEVVDEEAQVRACWVRSWRSSMRSRSSPWGSRMEREMMSMRVRSAARSSWRLSAMSRRSC